MLGNRDAEAHPISYLSGVAALYGELRRIRENDRPRMCIIASLSCLPVGQPLLPTYPSARGLPG